MCEVAVILVFASYEPGFYIITRPVINREKRLL